MTAKTFIEWTLVSVGALWLVLAAADAAFLQPDSLRPVFAFTQGVTFMGLGVWIMGLRA